MNFNTLGELEYEILRVKNKIDETKINHILHLFLSIITSGIWVFIWILLVIGSIMEKKSLNKQLKNLCVIREQFNIKK